MFGWFKEKVADEGYAYPPPFNDQQKVLNREELTASEPTVDDWETHVGDWVKATICHCGVERKEFSIGERYDPPACPRCGHTNKWVTSVCRPEWQESEARKTHYGVYVAAGAFYSRWNRNLKMVIWTPEHCNIKDKE